MTATTSSSTLDIFQTLILGMGQLTSEAAVVLIVFAFMLGLFTTLLLILGLWKTQ